MNGQYDSGEIQDEEIKKNMMKVPIKMCQKVSTADDQKVLGILKGWKKISFRKDQDFTPDIESIKWMSWFSQNKQKPVEKVCCF